jgi:DNA-binding LacI/PurR family transcriptional regulator
MHETLSIKQLVEFVKQCMESDKPFFLKDLARHFNVSRSTIYAYTQKYPELKELLEDAKEVRHDFVENAMLRGIREGNATLIIFYAKTQMRERGYSEKFSFDESQEGFESWLKQIQEAKKNYGPERESLPLPDDET